MSDVLFYMLILLAGLLAGLILAKLCKDEIKSWRKRLMRISGICLILAVVTFFINFEYKIPVIISLIFVIITDLTIVWRSYKR